MAIQEGRHGVNFRHMTSSAHAADLKGNILDVLIALLGSISWPINSLINSFRVSPIQTGVGGDCARTNFGRL